LFAVLLLLNTCSHRSKKEIKAKLKIAFGSCSKQSKDQGYWQQIAKTRPNYWLWLGDNVYVDSKNPKKFLASYRKLERNPFYKEFSSKHIVLGTWDDHDYGQNNAGKEFSAKEMSKKFFLFFLNFAKDDPIRKRPGIYYSRILLTNNLSTKLIFLDTRTFRDPPPKKNKELSNADILGPAQWSWLEKQLNSSKAEVNIIVSSIQVLSFEHRFEKWANFPKARERLLKLITKSQVRNPVILSGDRHRSEISKLKLENNFLLYDLTSSSLTHSWQGHNRDKNSLRLGPQIHQNNFSLLKVYKNKSSLSMSIEYYESYSGQKIYTHKLF